MTTSATNPNLLRVMVSRTADLAPLKPVAAKVIQMVQDENTVAMDLATVLSSGQALTSRSHVTSRPPAWYAPRPDERESADDEGDAGEETEGAAA